MCVHGKISVPAVQSLAGFLMSDYRKWFDATIVFATGSLIERIRSIHATNFLDNEELGDVFVFLDDDIKYSPADLIKIVVEAYQNDAIVAGTYPSRTPPDIKPTASNWDKTKDLLIDTDAQLIPIEMVGMGFTAIPRSVLENLALALPRIGTENMVPFFANLTPEIDGKIWFFGEDYSFCWRVKQAGMTVYVDQSICLEHQGYHMYTWADVTAPDRKD